MTPLLWRRTVRDFRDAHSGLMAAGRVIIPQMYLLIGNSFVGGIVLRPIVTGADAVTGIAEMSLLAAAAGAEESVVVWESCDLDLACGGEIPTGPRRDLDIVTATVDRYVLFRYPYKEVMLPGRASDGLRTARPQWLLPSLGEPGAALPPAIDELLESCWRPVGSDAPNLLDSTTAYLRTLGYVIDITHGR